MTIPPPDLPDITAGSTRVNGAATARSASDALLVAELGRRALIAADLTEFFFELVHTVSRRLETPFVKVLELVPDGNGLVLTAGVGWRPGYVGQVVVPVLADSQAGYTLETRGPVIVEDLKHEKRFRGMPFLHEHGIVSGISTVLNGRQKTWGIISVHTSTHRTFTREEVDFLDAVAGVVAAALDRRETERALIEQGQRLRLAMDAGRMGTWEWDIATNSVHWSESLEKIHGLEPGTFGGDFEAYASDIHPEDRDRVFNTIQGSVEAGVHELEYRIILPSGEVRWLTARGVLIRDEHDNPTRMIGVCSDITDNKIAEAVRRDVEARYQALFENATFGVFQTTPDGRFHSANRALARILGFPSAEMMIASVQHIGEEIHTNPERRAELVRMLQEDGEISGFISQARRHDGEMIWISITARASRDDSGNVTHYEGVLEDITERKRVEDERDRLIRELDVARIRMDNVVSNVPGVVWEAYGQPDGAEQRIDFVSGYVEQMLGYTVDEWLSTPNFWLTIVHPDDRERAGAEAAAIFASGTTGRSEFRWVARDGTIVWVEAQSSVITDMLGNPIGMRGVTMDITQRRLAETQVRETEERFSKAFHASPAGLSIVTAKDRRFIDVNESFLEIVGYTRDEVVGRLVDEVGIWAGQDERTKLEQALAAGEGHARNVEVQVRTRAGGLRSVLGSAEMVTLGGQPCVLSLMYDITERKRAEELLQESNDILKHAAGQQQLLAEASAILASSLDYEQMLSQVAALLVSRFCDVCSVDMIEGDFVRRVALAIGDQKQQAAFDNMPRTYKPAQGMAHPVFRVASSGKAVLYARTNDEMIQGTSRDEAHSEMLRALGLQSGIIVPLIAGGRSLGSMSTVSMDPGRLYTEEDKEFVQELARRAGLAIDNALQYQAQQQARHLAEHAVGRTERLQSITAALSESLTAEQVARVVTDAAIEGVHAKSGVIVRMDPRTEQLELVWAEGVVQEFHDTWAAFAANPPTAIVEGIKHGVPRFFESHEKMLERFPALATLGMDRGRSFCAVPLRVENSIIGGMVLTFGGAPPAEEDREFIVALARQCAQALERARLYEAEQRAREEAEAAGRRQAFLAEASAVLASSLDYEVTLSSVARLCVPYLGDWCSIDIMSKGDLQRVAVVHSDPEKVEWAKRLQEDHPPNLESDNFKRTMQGESFLYPEITDELLVQSVPDKELLQIMREMGLRSAISVPLRARGRTLGMLTLVTTESGRHYNTTDLTLAEDLGHRAGLAVDNALLFAESQEIQEELRRANEAKDEFLGLVSHELRTPITTIYGGARLLRSRGDSLDDESRNGVLDDIEHESERLHRIVEDLLVLARVELGQEVITEPVLVQRVAEKTVQNFARRRPNRVVRIEMDDALPAVRASNVYLEQILRNLINNADKYSPSDQPIDVQAGTHDEDAVYISVLDRGPGIPAEELELIFERFFRSEGTAKQAGGAGIGLTVCKRLIEAQDGRIWAEPRDGGGLIISFSLPIYEDGDEADA